MIFWRRKKATCDGYEPYSRCGEPAVACSWIMGRPVNVCEWHLEPMQDESSWWGLRFLARWYGPVIVASSKG